MREKSRVTVKIWGCMVVFEEIIKSIACVLKVHRHLKVNRFGIISIYFLNKDANSWSNTKEEKDTSNA
nr:hypothetical protein Iba_scaffold35357CG0040 [Ipomoea batatas]GMD01862.1 hypothetical protein Iba_chr05fCG11140 [Ipomoea batatas]GME06435.1 hypothetical protein Iba_scaffold4170CG0010 [Ipomoea batatas]GME06680.1 hypothetical protein Iba_scaffold4978CG0080 [Ipomoea batatas]